VFHGCSLFAIFQQNQTLHREPFAHCSSWRPVTTPPNLTTATQPRPTPADFRQEAAHQKCGIDLTYLSAPQWLTLIRELVTDRR